MSDHGILSLNCPSLIALITTLVLLIWGVARTLRWHSLVSQSVAVMSSESELAVADGGRPEFVRSLERAELAAYGGITTAEFVWSWIAIDPDLIRAADFSSLEHIRNGFDFAWYIQGHFDNLGVAAKEGFLARMSGYYAEQYAAHALEQAGHAVQFASAANQPVWDLIVDGHFVNVKNVMDVASIKAEALAHHDVLYLVPQDAYGETGGNIVPLPGMHHDVAKEAVHEGISAAHGETAMHAVGAHIPFVTIAFSAYRNIRQMIEDGKPIEAATSHFVKESVAKGTGVVLGAKALALLGTAIAPGAGTAVGAVLGAIFGGLGGGAIGRWWKSLPLKAAMESLESAIDAFGRSFVHQLEEIKHYTEAPLARLREAEQRLTDELSRRTKRLTYIIWPDPYTVMLGCSRKHARKNVRGMERRLASVRHILDRALHFNEWKPLGLLMVTEPNIREVIGYQERLYADVCTARENVYVQRRHLNPKFKRPNTIQSPDEVAHQ